MIIPKLHIQSLDSHMRMEEVTSLSGNTKMNLPAWLELQLTGLIPQSSMVHQGDGIVGVHAILPSSERGLIARIEPVDHGYGLIVIRSHAVEEFPVEGDDTAVLEKLQEMMEDGG